MAKTYLVDMDGTDIRFTPEGKVSVVDAIEALCAISRPQEVWQDLVDTHPGLGDLCETYSFGGAAPSVVVDAPGWSVIEELLPDHVFC